MTIHSHLPIAPKSEPIFIFVKSALGGISFAQKKKEQSSAIEGQGLFFFHIGFAQFEDGKRAPVPLRTGGASVPS